MVTSDRMPGIPTLQPEDASLRTLRKHWMFLRVGVESEPLAAALVPELTAFGPRFDTVAAEAQRLGDAVLLARTKAVAADHVLNRLADQVSAAIHAGKKPDIDLSLHQLYFGRTRPSVMKRPILGTQLEVMRVWPGHLAQATQPELLALAPAVAAGVEAAEEAATRLMSALTAEDVFKLAGARRELFAVYNALAARTFGALKGIGLNNVGLSPDWAESFFLHEGHGRETETVASVAAELSRLEKAVAAARRRLSELEAEEREAEAAKAAEVAAREAVAAAKRETAAAKQREKEAVAAAKKAKRLLP